MQKLIVVCLQNLQSETYHDQECLSGAHVFAAGVNQWWWPCMWAAFCWQQRLPDM